MIAGFGRRRAELPPADPEAAWCVLCRVRGYLENNRGRMDYPAYRREGLPITSSPVGSWIKRINQRVKGSEKFGEDGPRGEKSPTAIRSSSPPMRRSGETSSRSGISSEWRRRS